MSRLLLCLLLWAGTAVAAPAGPESGPAQFAYGLPLTVSGDQAFYQLELPLAVYRGSVRSDLGDLRVFNATGQVVPHVLRRPDNRTRCQEVAAGPLPFFPLPAGSGAPADDLTLQVERTPQGTVVKVSSAPPLARPDPGPPQSYLLDGSAIKHPMDILELFWDQDTPAFIASAVLQSSDDLVHWRRLTTATVARLSYGEYRLNQSRISLPSTPSRYLRLLWSEDPPPPLAGIQVLTRRNFTVGKPDAGPLAVNAEGAGAGRYRFDLQGVPPLTSVTIALPDKNSMAAVRLFSAENARGPWQERWHGLAYRLVTGGSELATPAIPLPTLRQRYWELRLEQSEASLATPPRLEFGWQPDRLVYLAQGEGPFLVAYGSTTVMPPDFDLDALLQQAPQRSLQPQLIQPGPPMELGGKLPAPGRPPLPWKKISLWGALLLGVLLIGGMSFSLYRSLRSSGPD